MRNWSPTKTMLLPALETQSVVTLPTQVVVLFASSTPVHAPWHWQSILVSLQAAVQIMDALAESIPH